MGLYIYPSNYLVVSSGGSDSVMSFVTMVVEERLHGFDKVGYY